MNFTAALYRISGNSLIPFVSTKIQFGFEHTKISTELQGSRKVFGSELTGSLS